MKESLYLKGSIKGNIREHRTVNCGEGIKIYIKYCGGVLSEMKKEMNKEMTILKAVGIIAVVIGHKYDPFTWYPTYSYHIVLFIFASGYFYNQNNEDNIIIFFIKKIKTLLIPYFIYNLFYAAVTYVLYKKNNILLGELPTLYNFFLSPFLHGHQYHLFLAGWFVVELFIIQISFILLFKMIKKINKSYLFSFSVFMCLALIGLRFAKSGIHSEYELVADRTLFGLFFYYLGFWYKNKLDDVQLIKSKYIIGSVILQIILIIKYKDVSYALSWCDFGGRLFLPIIASINGIYLCIVISKLITRYIEENDILLSIGENSFHIMANHLFVFLIMNFIIVKVKAIDHNVLNSVWYAYRLEKYWLVYVMAGILIPTYIAVFAKKSRIRLYETFKVKKSRIKNLNS
ncbi:acyltransferase family protein [Clostridium sp. CF011]|uniref:acyltransferase family protein n=1 Tax=Clostridium sp. CF011 TaxID=2843318 RepID=UPI001C0C46B1|nr:acyltransferase family protein [Clostridium sp. CF011]MBU3091665.1 acyltransferase family protein [Clostridium sp. CF011]WAG69377.1 acyltransferase family protein [Clostridium sp. CF011]